MKYLVLVLCMFALAGCTTSEQQRRESIEKAQQHCESEGKQFVLGNVGQSGDPFFTGIKTLVSGVCVGPGDPGYVPRGQPASPNPSS